MSPDAADYLTLIGSPESVSSETHIIVKYRIRAAGGIPLDTIAMQCALDGSTVAWTPLAHHTVPHLATFTTKVRSIEQTDEGVGIIELAFPVANMRAEIAGIPLLFATVAGSIFRERSIDSIRITDIQFPTSFLTSFPGPRHGIDGLRERLDVSDRPILLARIHDVGLPPSDTGEIARQLALGGADIIYTSPIFPDSDCSPFLERVDAVMKGIRAASKRTKRETLYFPSLTVSAASLLDMAAAALDRGAAGFETDMLSTGFSTVQAVRSALDAFVIFYPITHSLFTRTPDAGIDFGVFLKLGRLAGADLTCISSVVGRFEFASPMEVLRYRSVLVGESLRVKPSLPVVIGGQHPGNVRKTLATLGVDIGISAGSGILGHPSGYQAGAKAMRQSIDVCVHNLPEAETKKYREYLRALEQWGEE